MLNVSRRTSGAGDTSRMRDTLLSVVFAGRVAVVDPHLERERP
jgi:hypothetical protein